MDSWLRSLSVLAMAFVGVVVMTLGLAIWILPDGTAVAQGGSASASADPSDDTPFVPTGPPTVEGGTLTVTGVRSASFVLDRVHEEGAYTLVGNEGKIIMGGDPAEVTQVSFDGLDFYTDPGDCTITPGEHNSELGVAWAELECTDITDIRDTGSITVSGHVAVAANVLQLTGDLPTPGGTLTFGDVTVVADYGTFAAIHRPFVAGLDDTAMSIGGGSSESPRPPELREEGWYMLFSWNPENDHLALTHVGYERGQTEAPANACAISPQVIGRHSPRVSVLEVTLDCPAVEVPSLGVVPIRGTVIVNRVDL